MHIDSRAIIFSYHRILSSRAESIGTFDRDRFELLFKEHYSSLCSYAYNYTQEREASEEIVQDIFFKLWVNREATVIESSIKSYLFRAVRNSSLNLIKHIAIRENYKEYNRSEIEQSELLRAEDSPLTTELEHQIRLAIDSMPPQRKRIFIMSRYDDLKYREIATELNISIKTVENHMGRALAHLKDRLSEYLPIILLIYSDLSI